MLQAKGAVNVKRRRYAADSEAVLTESAEVYSAAVALAVSRRSAYVGQSR